LKTQLLQRQPGPSTPLRTGRLHHDTEEEEPALIKRGYSGRRLRKNVKIAKQSQIHGAKLRVYVLEWKRLREHDVVLRARVSFQSEAKAGGGIGRGLTSL
jgi:hypothetical protein